MFPMRHVVLLVLLAACSASDVVTDAGGDGGYVLDAGRDASAPAVDSGQDAGTDAGQDAGADAGLDSGVDSGPECECSSGPCCDGCMFRVATTPCGVEHVENDDVCYVTPSGPNYPKMSALTRDFHALRCSGADSGCPATSAETFQVYLDCIDACTSAGNCTTGCLTADNDLDSIDCWGPASCTPGDPDFMAFGICSGAAWPH